MVDWQERQGKAPDDFQGRFFPDVRVEMDSRLNRVYDWNLGSFTGFQHTIRPEVVYEYVPENLMGTLPHFDRLDGEQARHDIRYGFTTFLTGRETRNDAEGNPITKYRELARLQLFQLFNFEKPPQITPDPIFGPVPSFDTEALLGFADVGLRLDVMPKPYVMLSYSADFSPEKGQATIQDVFLTLKSGRGDTVRFNYVFRNDLPVDEFITDINVKVVSNLYLNTYHDYSFQKQNLFRQGYGVRYIRGCWAVALAYEREAQDERVAFSIDLLGLGTYGQRRLRHIGETLSGSVADDLEH
jgi:LPS-assembly protein